MCKIHLFNIQLFKNKKKNKKKIHQNKNKWKGGVSLPHYYNQTEKDKDVILCTNRLLQQV